MIVSVTPNPSLDKYAEIEALKTDDISRVQHTRYSAGGKGINVSRIVHLLGIETLALTFCGGINGSLFLELLCGEGIPSNIVPIAENIRQNETVFDSQSRQVYKLNEAGPKISETELTELSDRLDGYIQSENIFVLSGSLPQLVGLDFYTNLILKLSGRVKAILLDTESDILLKTATQCILDYIKPNTYETWRLLDRQQDILSNGQTVLKSLTRFARQPIVSLGEKGVLFQQNEGECVRVYSASTYANPSVGAGDCFVGGFVTGLSQNWSLIESAKLGVACAAALVHNGGFWSLTRAKIEAEKHNVVVEVLQDELFS